ncbi:MAG TPA: hypothetical protein VFZ31_06090 [Vicinamibacterales bacterium]
MACPICNSPEGAAINDGMRAGAAILILALTVVAGMIVRYGVTLWRQDQRDA